MLAVTACFIIIGLVAGLIFIKPVYSTSAYYLVTDTSGMHYEIVHPDEIRKFFRHDYFTKHLAEHVSDKFTAKELKKMVKIKVSRTSPVFRVTVTHRNDFDVYYVQNTIERMPRQLTPELSDKLYLIVRIEGAGFPEKSKRPGMIIVLIIFALAGACSSFFYTKKHPQLFRKRSAAESVLRFKLPVIARIPTHPGYGFHSELQNTEFTKTFLKNSGIITARKTGGGASSYNPEHNTIMINSKTNVDFFDAFRKFYSSLTELDPSGKGILLFTSPGIGDGKTTAAINLGITAAAQRKRVLLIDCNFRNRRLTKAFNIDPELPGLYDIVFDNVPAKDAILYTEYNSLFILPQGNSRNINPLTLLTRADTISHLTHIKELFDYVIIDSPSVNAFSDALTLTGISDHVFLVIRSDVTRDSETEKALKSLELSEVDVTGLILNDIQYADMKPSAVPDSRNISRNKFISGFKI